MPHPHAVAAGHPLTADAAESILRSGGNAFDAAVAAMAAACVVEPVLASLGGGGFALACPARGRPACLDFFVHTPRRREAAEALDFYPIEVDFGPTTQEFHIGRGTVAVPGMVAGMFRLSETFGSVPMTQLLSPAVALAANPTPVNEYQADLLQMVCATFTASAESRRIFCRGPDGDRLLGAGEALAQPDLADALDALAREGERLFYEGEIAARIEEDLGHGGQFGRDELRAYRVERRSPLETSIRGARLLSNPPPSSGGVLAAFALGILDAPDLQDLDRDGLDYVTRLIDAQSLTSQARIDRVARGEALDRGLLDPALLDAYREQVQHRRRAHRGTTHISIIDRDGNLASVTLSNGEGSGYVVPGTGIVLNNMLGEEDLNPGGFQRWRPGERMTSMMMPSAVGWPDGTLLATGSGGSNRIRTALVQVLTHLLVFGDDVEAAVIRPRVHLEGERLDVEGGHDAERLAPLLEAYPDHRVWPGRSAFFGGAHSVRAGPRGVDGCGDPRRGGVFVTG